MIDDFPEQSADQCARLLAREDDWDSGFGPDEGDSFGCFDDSPSLENHDAHSHMENGYSEGC